MVFSFKIFAAYVLIRHSIQLVILKKNNRLIEGVTCEVNELKSISALETIKLLTLREAVSFLR